MYFSEAAIRPLPQLRVGHSPQEVACLLRLILSVGLNLQSVDLLQNFSLFVQQQLEGKLLLLLRQLS